MLREPSPYVPEHDIDAIYDALLAWHHLNDPPDIAPKRKAVPPVPVRSKPDASGGSSDVSERAQQYQSRRNQGSGLLWYASEDSLPSLLSPRTDNTNEASSTAELVSPRDPQLTPRDQLPMPRGRKNSFKGSLRKMGLTRTNSVSSLKDLFEHSSK